MSARKGSRDLEQGHLWGGFVDIPLENRDKEEIMNGSFVFPTLVDGVGSLLEEGYKVTFSYHSRSASAVCTFTGSSLSCENKGKSLSGWAPDHVAAFNVAWYKHAVRANKGLWEDEAVKSGSSIR